MMKYFDYVKRCRKLLPTLILTGSMIFGIWILCSQSVKAAGEGQPEGSYKAYILDEADLLSDSEEQQLYQNMQDLLPYGNVIFSSVILDTGRYEQYAEDTYYELCQNEPGVIFQIDMGNRKLTLSASTEMENRIGKERDSIVDNIYRMASNEDYYGCASECYLEIWKVINNEAISHCMKYIDNAIVALLLALILNYFVILILTRQRKWDAEILGQVAITAAVSNVLIKPGKVSKRRAPVSSGSSSGGGYSGGGGGGGGGGFSGGSSSHGF